METNNKDNHFNNPVVIILLLALIGLGGYVVFSKNSSGSDLENKTADSSGVPQTQETQVAPTQPQPTNTVKQKTEPSPLTVKQAECKNLLLPFTIAAMNDASAAQTNAQRNYPPTTVVYIKTNSAVLGYSPSLEKCVGGYWLDNYTVTNNYESSHKWAGVIASISSDLKLELITSFDDNSNIEGLAKQYEGKLYELTNGEIGKIKW